MKLITYDSIERRKEMLVAKDCYQQIGIDYAETFSSMVKLTTIQLVFSIIITREWCLRKINIQNAFPHCLIYEIILMQQQQGFVDLLSHHFVCKLN